MIQIHHPHRGGEGAECHQLHPGLGQHPHHNHHPHRGHLHQQLLEEDRPPHHDLRKGEQDEGEQEHIQVQEISQQLQYHSLGKGGPSQTEPQLPELGEGVKIPWKDYRLRQELPMTREDKQASGRGDGPTHLGGRWDRTDSPTWRISHHNSTQKKMRSRATLLPAAANLSLRKGTSAGQLGEGHPSPCDGCRIQKGGGERPPEWRTRKESGHGHGPGGRNKNPNNKDALNQEGEGRREREREEETSGRSPPEDYQVKGNHQPELLKSI